MLIETGKITETEYARMMTVQGPKVSAFVHLELRSGRVNVTCRNAQHRVYRGVGRFFDSWELAVDGYKSDEMKSLIRAAQALIA